MKKKLKVLMINYEFPPLLGGAANATLNILKKFEKDKYLEIDLITCSESSKEQIIRMGDNITIYKINIKRRDISTWTKREVLIWTIKAQKLAKNLVKNKHYDLCHCWFGWPCGYIGYKLNKKFNVPYIISLRGSDVPGHNPKFKLYDGLFFRRLSRKVWRQASLIISNSKKLGEEALETLNREIEIIPNGVDIEFFKPGLKKSGRIKIISVGRLHKVKGYEYLIRALRDLDVKLILIGDGEERNSLEALAEENKVDVDFQGYQTPDKILKELQDSDIFVLSSLNEGMSNSVLEAMATRLPIISTDVGGTRELIRSGDNGFIVKNANSEDIREKLLQLINNKKLMNKMGKRSRKLAATFSWKNFAEAYRRAYYESLGR